MGSGMLQDGVTEREVGMREWQERGKEEGRKGGREGERDIRVCELVIGRRAGGREG